MAQQTLWNVIQDIASRWQDAATRRRYQNAAEDFRIPYLDWGTDPPLGASYLPDSIGGAATIYADGPNGVQLIANPLYTYLFKPLNSTAFLTAPVSSTAAMRVNRY